MDDGFVIRCLNCSLSMGVPVVTAIRRSPKTHNLHFTFAAESAQKPFLGSSYAYIHFTNKHI